jgi:hypothetical protein
MKDNNRTEVREVENELTLLTKLQENIDFNLGYRKTRAPR